MSRIDFTEYQYGVYAYCNDKGIVVYIGSDSHINEGRRDGEHRKPSKGRHKTVVIKGKEVKRKPQLINVKIKELGLTYVPLAVTFNKEIMYDLETMYINKYKPIYNEKMVGWKDPDENKTKTN